MQLQFSGHFGTLWSFWALPTTLFASLLSLSAHDKCGRSISRIEKVKWESKALTLPVSSQNQHATLPYIPSYCTSGADIFYTSYYSTWSMLQKKTSAWVLQNLAFLLSLDYSLELLFQQSPGRNLQNTSAYVWRSSTKHTQFEQTKTKSSWSLPVSPRKLSVESYSSAQTTKLTGIPENFVPFWVGFVDHKTTKQQLKPRHSLSSSSSSAASLGHGAVGAVDPPKRLMVSCDIMQHHYACWLVYGKIMWNIPHFLFTYMGYFNAMYHGWQTPTEKYSTPKKSKSGLGAFEDKNPLKTHSLAQVLLK